MKESVAKAIREHAVEEAPREACGLIVKIGASEVCIRAKNIAEEPVRRFIMDPNAYVEALKAGEILAIYHSHATNGEGPSDADRAACGKTHLPWYVYTVAKDRFDVIYPEGKIAPLIGRHFVWKVFDCWTLMQDYYQQELAIILPDFEYEERFWEKGKNYYMEKHKLAGFEQVMGEMQLHDVLLMQINSRVVNHAAIYVGNNKILHHFYRRLSCKDVYGGYWRHVTSGIFRHRRFL
jgi:proteasome lid subunit RPN8/RPN11